MINLLPSRFDRSPNGPSGRTGHFIHRKRRRSPWPVPGRPVFGLFAKNKEKMLVNQSDNKLCTSVCKKERFSVKTLTNQALGEIVHKVVHKKGRGAPPPGGPGRGAVHPGGEKLPEENAQVRSDKLLLLLRRTLRAARCQRRRRRPRPRHARRAWFAGLLCRRNLY